MVIVKRKNVLMHADAKEHKYIRKYVNKNGNMTYVYPKEHTKLTLEESLLLDFTGPGLNHLSQNDAEYVTKRIKGGDFGKLTLNDVKDVYTEKTKDDIMKFVINDKNGKTYKVQKQASYSDAQELERTRQKNITKYKDTKDRLWK